MSLRRILFPLVPLYAAAAAAKNALYDRGAMRQKSLAWPVISVGNLSTGGSGKTPFVLALRDLLAGLGWEVDVLSRGYGRTGFATELVDPSGSAAHFGDEPLLLARAGAAVYVGADRYRAGQLAERQAHTAQPLHILDDGMQHRRLARQVEIVLLLQADLHDGLLPAGNLREPLSSLRRADIIVLREEDAGVEAVARKLLGPARTPLFWHVQRALRFKTMVGTLVPAPPRSLAFCALARPEDFFQSLRKNGCDPLSEVCFRDHHFYTAGDMAALAGQAYARNATHFVVTAKDACKLTSDLMAVLTKVAPVIVADLVTTIQNKEKSAAELTALLLRSYDERVRG
ncbi:MAG TPA: tetraacyldisaccharide 4'-kinase [Acidobacteriaceae bacterium]|jgi:tetraacyldisaccharide 4'-kinase|nr:tetraacyldisaccharide 4'-kinase [Acidobacteriaceae bacterium]